MKLTETQLRSIVREELQRLSEAQVEPLSDNPVMSEAGEEVQQFLYNNGMRISYEMFEYQGLYFHIDPMDRETVFINVFRDRNDSESVVSATIERDTLKIQEPSTMPGGFPKTDKVRYTGPRQVVEALVERATGGQTAYR